MLVIEGYFDTNERFISRNIIPIPVGKRTIVTILDEPPNSPKSDEKAFWVEFDRLAAAASDEVLRDEEFARTNISRELELSQ
jgi:hypothetical protein